MRASLEKVCVKKVTVYCHWCVADGLNLAMGVGGLREIWGEWNGI